MAGCKLTAAQVPTPGPWLARGAADEGASPVDLRLGVEPATEERRGGGPYLIRQDHLRVPDSSLVHVATGIQRLADAKLMAASPELAETLLRLLTTQALTVADLDPDTRAVVAAAWDVLVQAAPHLEI